MEIKLPIYFMPLITVSLLVFALGLYLNVVRKIGGPLYTWKAIIVLSKFDAPAFWGVLFQDVLFLRWLKKEDGVRWLRHLFLYWGFMALWLFDISYAIASKRLPDRNAFINFLHAGLDLTGLMLLGGTLFALIRFLFVRRTSGRVFSYLPETTLLFLVTLSGFLLEITYILSAPDPRPFAYHLVGYQTARLVAPLQWPWNNLLPVVLAVHLLLVASFFAYIPFSRLVHVMATPLGRLLNSQTAILAEKRRTVVSGLLNLEGHRLP